MASKVKATPATPEQQSRQRRKNIPKSNARKKLPFSDNPSLEDAELSSKPSFEEPAATTVSSSAAPATPSRRQAEDAGDDEVSLDSETPVKALSAKKIISSSPSKSGAKLKFGTGPRTTTTLPEVQAMYKVVNRCTGSLGGNGHGGAIYGEQTQASMQKVVDLMVTKGELDSESVFIDVGAGLGKPNMHVGLQPKVKYSVGIEMEHVRWLLSLHNLKHVLENDENQASSHSPANVVFLHGDCFEAKSFDPFTHVYMFDIGMPPALFLHMAECLRNSRTAKYVLCYHAPSLMIDNYGFEMEFIDKQATSMHGSSEGHTAYLYKCTHKVKKEKKKKGPQAAVGSKRGVGTAADPSDIVHASDPLFKEAFEVLSSSGGKAAVSEWVTAKLNSDARMSGQSARPRTRAQAKGEEGGEGGKTPKSSR